MKNFIMTFALIAIYTMGLFGPAKACRLAPASINFNVANWSSQQGVEYAVLPYGQVIHNSAPYHEKYNRVSYTFYAPQGGYYVPQVRYAAATARPVKLNIDGDTVYNYFAGGETGGWVSSYQTTQCYQSARFYMTSGYHTITLERNGSFPHISQLALIPS
jgi:hypothetical protein